MRHLTGTLGDMEEKAVRAIYGNDYEGVPYLATLDLPWISELERVALHVLLAEESL